jgi:phosphoribosylformimino-5-aminoimidazole carboxamide ribotide isomerase
MRVVGVLDLVAGRAVHARGGKRESYQPVPAVAGSPIEVGDALALATAYLNRLGVAELYVADLDAILGFPSQDGLITGVAALAAPLWLDAGVSSGDQARHSLALGAARVVVGLETLPSYEALENVCRAVTGSRVAFSLDLRDGRPILAAKNSEAGPDTPPHEIAARAAAAGVGAVVVLDLARVGGGNGLDVDLIARVRQVTPGLTLLAGGGVRGLDDLRRLADAGCDGALVATALYDGGLTAVAIAAAQRL